MKCALLERKINLFLSEEDGATPETEPTPELDSIFHDGCKQLAAFFPDFLGHQRRRAMDAERRM
jgi:hypothetical protein